MGGPGPFPNIYFIQAASGIYFNYIFYILGPVVRSKLRKKNTRMKYIFLNFISDAMNKNFPLESRKLFT